MRQNISSKSVNAPTGSKKGREEGRKEIGNFPIVTQITRHTVALEFIRVLQCTLLGLLTLSLSSSPE